MASVISICNLALSNIGKDNINDLAEMSAEARACRQFYEHVRDTMLQAYPWRFAGKTQSLGELANDKTGEWGYAYARPVACMKVRSVNASRSDRDKTGYPYEIEGDKIYCDLSPAFLRFTDRLIDPTKFSSLFIEALSWQLAARLAMPLTRDPKMRADCFNAGGALQAAAEASDANEVREASDHDSEFVTGRM